MVKNRLMETGCDVILGGVGNGLCDYIWSGGPGGHGGIHILLELGRGMGLEEGWKDTVDMSLGDLINYLTE